MPNNQTNITIGVKYNVDQTSVNAIKKSLQDLQKIKVGDFSGSERNLEKLQGQIRQVQKAFTKAFNVNLNTLNIEKFNNSLNKIFGSSENIYKSFAKFGAKGQVAFSQMANSVMSTNLRLRETHSIINQMGQTMANTVKWGVASSVMNSFTNSVQQAFQYVKSLDSALTDIRIVTGDSTEQMKEFAAQANNAAQSLGRSTMDYTKAALSFYQQGLSDEDVQARTQAVLKAQNITGAGDEMADYLTAVWNGYKVANEEAELYVDKLASVADSSASNMSQLAIAMSKVASTANAMGVDVDQLNAQIATIVATTRQAPESVGNALKTIYSRINDISTGAEGAEVSLGNYSKQMKQVGFDVLDANGNLRDTGEVIEEIGGKWSDLSREEQIYLARTMAGQRQYNNLIALFDNWSKYSDLVNVSMDSQGTLMEKNSRYMESLAAKMEQLGAAGERVKSSLINQEDLKGIIQVGTQAVNIFANLIESIGGGKGALLNFGSVFTQIFSGTIAKEVSNIFTSSLDKQYNQKAIQAARTRYNQNSAVFKQGLAGEYADDLKEFYSYQKILSDQDKQTQLGFIERRRELREEKAQLEQNRKSADQYIKTFSKGTKDLSTITKTGIETALKDGKKTVQGLKSLSEEVNNFTETTKSAAERKGNIRKDQEGLTSRDRALIQFNQDSAQNSAQAEKNLEKLLNLPGIDAENNKAVKVLTKIKETGEVTQAQIKQLNEEYDRLINKTEQGQENVRNKNKDEHALQRNKEEFDDVNLPFEQQAERAKLQQQTQDVIKFTAGLSQLFAVASNIKNLGQIWSNDNISSGQKIFQIISNIGMSIPQVLIGISSIKAALPGVAAAMGVVNAESMTFSQLLPAMTVKMAGFLATAAPFIAIGAAIGLTIYEIYKEWNRAADAAEKAAQKTKKAQEIYNSLKESSDNLKTSLDNLASAKDHFNELTKGTQQWRTALQEVNDQVLSLMQEFPELKNYVDSTSEGLLYITEEGQKIVQQAYQQRSIASGLAYANADRISTEAQNYSSVTNASRKLDGVGGLTPDQLKEVVDAVNQHGEYILENSKWLDQNTSLSSKDIQVVQENTGKISELANQVNANTTASQNLTSAILRPELANNSLYQNSSNQDAFAKLVQNSLKNATLDDSYYDIGGVDLYNNQLYKNLDLDSLAQAWAEDLGKTFGQDIQVKGIGAFKKIQQKVNGQWQDVSTDLVVGAVAYQDAVKNIDSIYSQVNQQIQSLGEKSSSILAAFGDNLADFDWSKFSISDIKQALNNDELINIIANSFQVNPEDVQRRLKNSYQDMWNGYINYLQQLPDFVKESLEKYVLKQPSESMSQQMKEAIGKLLRDSYSKGLEEFKNTQNLLEGLDVQEILPFQQIINNLSGTNFSLDDFKNALTQADITLDNVSNEALQNFISQIRAVEEAISPEESYKTIHDIVDGLQVGDIVSAEDAAKLEEAGLDFDEYFIHMADGSLRLKTSAEEFYNYVNNQTLQGFKDKIQSLKEQVNTYTTLNNSKYSASNAGKNADQVFKDFSSSAYQHNVGEGQYSGSHLQQQLNFLKAIGVQEEIITTIEEKREKHLDIFPSQLQEIADLVYKQKGAWQQVGQTQEQLENQLENYREKLAYAGLEQLTSLKELREALYNNDDGMQISRQDQLAREKAILETYAVMRDKYLEDEVDRLDITRQQYDSTYSQLQTHLKETYEDFNELTEAQQQVEIDQLTSRVYDLGDSLDQLSNISQEAFDEIQYGIENNLDNIESLEGFGELQSILSEIFQTPISTEEIETNFNLIRQLAQGDITALVDLQAALGQDYIAQIAAQVDTPEVNAAMTELQGLIDSTELEKLELGVSLDEAGFTEALQNFASLAGLGAEEINEILGRIGFEPQVTEQVIPFDEIQQGGTEGQYTYSYELPQDMGGGTRTIRISADDYNTAKAAGSVTIPIINGKKTHYVGGASTGSFARPSYSMPKAPSNRGGGGSGSKPKQPAREKTQKLSKGKDPIKDRSDVYHDINLELDKQEDILDDIQKEQKKLVDKDRLENLKKQNKQLEKQSDLLDQKSTIATGELVRLRNELASDLGNGIRFDSNGQIANYNEALDNARDNYNNAIADYNKRVREAQEDYNKAVEDYNSLSAEQQEAHKTALERQKELMDQTKDSAQTSLDIEKAKYDAIKNNIKEYDDTLKLQRDIANKQQQIYDKILENQITMSKIKVDLSIDTGDFERDWLDFENKFIKKLDKDDFLGSAKASAKELMSYFNSDQVQQTASEIDKIRKEIAIMQAGGASSIYSVVDKDGNIVAQNLAQAQEDLEDYMKQQMDDLGDVQDLIDDIKDNYLDALDNAKDKMDDQIDQYERVNDLIDHNVKLTQMLYGDTAYNTMNKYYELQKANNKNQLDSLRMQQQYWQDLMKNQTKNSPAWNQMKKNLDDVTDNLNSKLEEMIENLSDQWQNRVDGIITKLNNALTGGRGLDYLDEQWDYINTFDDNFLDTFESNMGIQEVTDLYQQAIDGLSGSPANQQKINKLINEQLKILREKDNLTQYDIDRAKAALEVEKARMALEDARYNKTKMRLRRDSQGNYTYQYVADEEKLGDLQAALADAQANLYNMDKEHYTQNLNTLYDAYKDYIDKMRELTEEYNNTQDAKERARIQARIDLLRQSTNNLMQGLTEDNKYALQYLNESFFGGMGIDTTLLSADEQMEIMTQNIPQMQSNIQDLANTLVGEGGILNATNDAMKQISDATVEYDKNVKQFLTDAGSSLQVVTNVTDAAGNALDKNIVQAEKLITTNQELINQCNAQVDAIQKMLSYLDQFMTKVINVEELITRLRAGYNTGQSLNGSNLTADELGVASLGLDSTTGMNFTGDFTGNPKTDAAAVKQQFDAIMAQYEQFLTQMSIAKFDTGGSTGSWGDAEGRLAFLHEKELVLNQQDTANILAAVEAVRMITGSLNGLATGEIGSLINNATGLLGGIDNTSTLDQNVHIEANFPNVTQHTEIEQAFNNLVNMASMRASGYRD